jgi:type IV fimbrial biogenesis protein FimT
MKTPLVNRGFTSVELLTVVSVLAVVTAIAAPAMRSFTTSQRVKAASMDLGASLVMARSEALKRNMNVQLVRTGTDWNQGWQVKTVSTSAVLGTQNAMNTAVSFSGMPDSIVFNAMGRVSTPATAVRVQIAASDGSTAVRCVTVAPSGQARASMGACP